MDGNLLEPGDYRLIGRLSLAAKRRVSGLITGEQRSPARSGGIEFADYREYQPGDDVRRIDWAVFLRLRRLLIRLCAEEKELTLMVILDASRSMKFGQPEKLRFAGRLAAILAGIALHDGNRAGVLAFGPHLRELLRPQRGRASLTDVAGAITRLEEAETLDAAACTREFAARYGKKCMAVFLSDLLFPAWSQAVGGLSASGCEVYVVQILAPEELDPPYLGEVTLADREGRGEVELHLGAAATRRYRDELARFLREVRGTCHRLGLGHALIPTDLAMARALHTELRQEGLLC